jgi:outer membrane protein assembly factor BamD
LIKRSFLISITTAIILTGCAKDEVVYNKSAKVWYNKIVNSISSYNLDRADKEFTSLESEHRNSPLLKEATLILANAHMEQEEYLLANYYLDKYIKRFARISEVEYIEFLKIESKFLSFKYPNREQQLLQSTLDEIKNFLEKYPESKYKELANHMYSRLFMAQIDINKNISNLYKRINKSEASNFYKDKIQNSFIEYKDIESAKIPWYKEIFNKL